MQAFLCYIFHFDFCILLVEYDIVYFFLTLSDPFLNSNTSKLRNVNCENFIYDK